MHFSFIIISLFNSYTHSSTILYSTLISISLKTTPKMFSNVAILATAAALVGSVSAVGSARVQNNCGYEVTLWSVGSEISNAFTIPAGGNAYAEPFTRDAKTGGRTIKVTRERDGLFTQKPQTNFAYSLDGAAIWYDLSDVFGDPFKGCKITVTSADKNCPSITWQDGIPPAGSQVKTCGSNNDVTLTLCAA